MIRPCHVQYTSSKIQSLKVTLAFVVATWQWLFVTIAPRSGACFKVASNVISRAPTLSSQILLAPSPPLLLPCYSVHATASDAQVTSQMQDFEISEEERLLLNPPMPKPPPKVPATFIHDDPLDELRIDKYALDANFQSFASLPLYEFRRQTKGRLSHIKRPAHLLAKYANDLDTLIANYVEWSRAFGKATAIESKQDLHALCPLLHKSYFCLVFHCAWQSSSIALVRAISQLLGCGKYTRDPPAPRPVHKRPKRYRPVMEPLEDLLAEIQRDDELRAQGLPVPDEVREPIFMRYQVPDADVTLKLARHMQEAWNCRWWLPSRGFYHYNDVVAQALYELQQTSYSGVVDEESRKAYIAKNTPSAKRKVRGEAAAKLGKTNRKDLVHVNFVLVRLANSTMISHCVRGRRKHRRNVLSNEKELRFNETMLRMLIDEGILYKDMPAMMLYENVTTLPFPALVSSKSMDAKPFSTSVDEARVFFKGDVLDVARSTPYGMPPLRKILNLAIAQDFKHVGTLYFNQMPEITNFDEVYSASVPHEMLRTAFKGASDYESARGTTSALQKVSPILGAVANLYQMHLKRIVDARPVPVKYYYLNP